MSQNGGSMPEEPEVDPKETPDDPKPVGEPDKPVGDPKHAELIAENKKYRQRAQDAEGREKALIEAKDKTDSDALLKKEEFKTLYEQTQAKLDVAQPLADDWTNYQTSKRTEIMDGLSDDDKGIAEGLSDLTKLEQFAKRVSPQASDSKVPGHRPGKVAVGERKDQAAAIMDSYQNNGGLNNQKYNEIMGGKTD